jgi:hypothetical protein
MTTQQGQGIQTHVHTEIPYTPQQMMETTMNRNIVTHQEPDDSRALSSTQR